MGEQKTGKRWICVMLSAVLLATTAMMGFSGVGYAAEAEDEEVPYVQGQVLVEFEESVSELQAERIVEDAGGEDAQIVTPSQEEAICLVTLEKGTEVDEAIEQIEKEKKVVSVQPNYMYRLTEDINVDTETNTASDLNTEGSLESDTEETVKTDTTESISSENADYASVESADSESGNEETVQETKALQETSGNNNAATSGKASSLGGVSALDDPQVTKQWHLDKIQTQEGWELLDQMPHSKVRVAVLDTGVRTTHEDLQENLNKTLSVDATKTSLPKLTSDALGHGTHVAGILGADSGNGKGIAGVGAGLNNDVLDLFAVNVFKYVSSASILDGLPAGYYAFTSDIIRGLNYAAGKNAKVINLSLGMYTSDAMLKSKVKEIGTKKCTIVAAAGNDDVAAVPYANYPSDYAECIGVIATTKNKKRASFSNYGSSKDISAPGADILSTVRTGNNKYDFKSGTSMAAPVVSGAAALLYSMRPKLTANQVKYILYNSTDDLYTTGKDKYSGYGQVNVYKALKKLKSQRFVTGMKLSRTSVKLGKGRGFILKATVSSTATNKKVNWTSSNTKVATVSSSGKVTAKAAGTATITARPKDGSSVAKSCKVTVLSVGKPKVTKVQRKTKTRSVVYLTSVKNVDGYEVLYSRDKKFRKYRHTYRTKYRPATIKSLTSGKRYYFKVRAYKKDSFGNRIYGSYSNVKSN